MMTKALTVGFACAGFFVLGALATHECQSIPPTAFAAAQSITHDPDVRWVGYLCGDDGTTVLSREMPGPDCKESQRLARPIVRR
jgi:hypothetical protein